MINEQNKVTDQVKRVAIGADHGAFETKESIKTYLQTIGYTIVDVGTDNSSMPQGEWVEIYNKGITRQLQIFVLLHIDHALCNIPYRQD